MFADGKAFKTHDEAYSVCASLENITGKPYTVVRKNTLGKCIYKVCCISDYNYDVKQKGYVISDD